jgi:hypothetical protein
VGWQPLIAVQGEALYLATSSEFFATCLSKSDRLAKSPAFVKALAELGNQGN